MKGLNLPLFAILIFFGFGLGCKQASSSKDYQLGETEFESSGKEEAREPFKRGILLLHSFEYADAAEAFREAITIDPDFTMAYWGEAMTCNHPIWQEQDLEKGQSILNQLAPTPEARLAKAATEWEKDMLGGIHILFGEGNKAVRDSSYAEYMAGLYKKYPGNNEVASFYSLALIGWAITGRQSSVSEQAAKIGQEILERNPNHPGALHYIIHAWDHPAFAAKAMETANRYAQVAPDAGHALHMPTHTYVALGLWDRVVSSNEVSWAADKDRMERKKLTNDALSYHSYHWLQYGLLQLGNNERARRMLDSMRNFSAALPSPKARSHVAMMQATYLAETEDFDATSLDMNYKTDDLNLGLRAARNYVKGVYAFRQKDTEGLNQVITLMASERLVDAERVLEGGLRMCGNINRSLPTHTNLLESEAMEAQLRAMQAMLLKDQAKAGYWLKTAVRLQDEAGYSFGPPNIVKPSYELYGEWLLELGKPGDAKKQFELSLKLFPNRRISSSGLQKALAMEGLVSSKAEN